MTAVVVVEAAAIGLLAVLVFALLRTQAHIVASLRHLQVAPDQVHSPPLAGADQSGAGAQSGAEAQSGAGAQSGQVAAAVAGVDLRGQPSRLEVEGPVVLAFLTSGCASCGWWWEQLRHGGRLVLPDLVVVTPDPETDSPDDVGPLAGEDLRVIMSSETWAAYGVRAGSTFAVVGGGMVRASGPVSSWDGLVSLVAAARLAG